MSVTEKQPSLILITVDCLRADHCGFHGYRRPTTPFLDSLASESIVAPTAVVAGAPTYYSLPAIFASRMPLALGRDVIGLAPGEETLATKLREAGYSNAAFSAANPYISSRLGFDQGFGEFRDFVDFGDARSREANKEDASHQRNGNALQNSPHRSLSQTFNQWLKKSAQAVGLEKGYDELYFQYLSRIAAAPAKTMDGLRKYPSADMVLEAAKAWLSGVGSQPFFLWLHLMDPHAPYYPPQEAFQQLTGKEISPARARYLNACWNRSDLSAEGLRREKGAVVDLYDASILWADTQIEQFVEFLSRTGIWENCVLALTADHGEEFLEHGRRFHVPVSMAEAIVRVPLLLRVPLRAAKNHGAKRAGSRLNDPFSLIDLAPTLLDILEIPSPASFRGKSLWRNADDPSEHSFDPAVTEMVYNCSNPFREETRLSPRLLSVRDERYKLVIQLKEGEVEQLYDLQADPLEQNPVPSGKVIEVRKRLLKAAAAEIERTIAERPVTARMRSVLREVRLELGA
jgi:arylsulfatase A-like enzyme